MKLIKIIESEEHGNMELYESDLPRMTRFTIWFNGKIISDAKTLKGGLNALDKKAVKNNLIT